jgi:hypothetical protein
LKRIDAVLKAMDVVLKTNDVALKGHGFSRTVCSANKQGFSP